MSRSVVLAAGKRTAFGDFGGSLKDKPLSGLGAHVVQATLATAGIDAARIDHLTFGNVTSVDHDGNFISRKVALDAGLPIEFRGVDCEPGLRLGHRGDRQRGAIGHVRVKPSRDRGRWREFQPCGLRGAGRALGGEARSPDPRGWT